MLNGVMLLWFILTGLSVVYVAIDIRSTPESTVMKWGFVLVTAFIGPLGAFLYVLGCREPLPGMHEEYVSARWRQVLGSTMHCVAGDGVGIFAGGIAAALLHLSPLADIGLEYVLGFGFGWGIFQALFMREMMGGSYRKALTSTFVPELLSMNAVMAGMIPVMTLSMKAVPGSHDIAGAAFWFLMSMGLLAGFIVAFPVNWWLVSNNLKHGMMTVRPAAMQSGHSEHAMDMPEMNDQVADEHAEHDSPAVSRGAILAVTVLTFAMLGAGLAISGALGGLKPMHAMSAAHTKSQPISVADVARVPLGSGVAGCPQSECAR